MALIRDVEIYFVPSSQSLAKEIFASAKYNKHLHILVEHLPEGLRGLEKISEYGLKFVPRNFPKGGDADIAQYFFLISELAGLDPRVRSFAIDIMEYCRGFYEYDIWYKNLNPAKMYGDDIKPLLK